MKTYRPAFFMGANTPQGFYSLFGELDRVGADTVMVIKGGPGCGKSSLMKKTADAFEGAGRPCERIYCSSDVNSLDAVILPDVPAYIVDGTAPHTVEPPTPGAVGRIVDMGAMWDREKIKRRRDEIEALTALGTRHRLRATRLLRAAAALREERDAAVFPAADREKLSRLCARLVKKELGRGDEKGENRRRFLTAMGGGGVADLFCSLDGLRVTELKDRWGIAPLMLCELADCARKRGYDTVECMCTQSPGRIEHLIIPAAGAAFVSSNRAHGYCGPSVRSCDLARCVDPDVLRENRGALRLSAAMTDTLLEQAAEALRAASDAHGELEKIYTPAMDFSGADRLFEEVAGELLETPRKTE